ncbi:hypothetical protein M9H77_28026 [Catharanthus roseus]|uniref:Uncharacterized protein n=1 Tax=Catharanthus roseus TaxID=4058 RepID=A0ACC0AE72_CATRO|nr:hypothetical protein M9H77_28026 [Catharanthus roseus]
MDDSKNFRRPICVVLPKENFLFFHLETQEFQMTETDSSRIFGVFQYFKITFFGPSDHIGIGKIYNRKNFKRMGFSRNEDGEYIRGGEEEESENSKDEEEEGNEPRGMAEEKEKCRRDSKGIEI